MWHDTIEAVARTEAPDDLDRHIVERARKNPDLPAMVLAHMDLRCSSDSSPSGGLRWHDTDRDGGAHAHSQLPIGRLESGEHNVRVSTLERYAAAPPGCPIAMTLIEAPER